MISLDYGILLHKWSFWCRCYTKKTPNFVLWKGIRADVKAFIQRCDICQRSKADLVAYPGLLQPLPISEVARSQISMDFIDGLPKSKGHEVILVVVDRLSKYAHFIPLKHPYTTQSIAKTFLDVAVRLHRLPDIIISDRDAVFLS